MKIVLVLFATEEIRERYDIILIQGQKLNENANHDLVVGVLLEFDPPRTARAPHFRGISFGNFERSEPVKRKCVNRI